jgi:hypothetical protein
MIPPLAARSNRNVRFTSESGYAIQQGQYLSSLDALRD